MPSFTASSNSSLVHGLRINLYKTFLQKHQGSCLGVKSYRFPFFIFLHFNVLAIIQIYTNIHICHATIKVAML